MPLEMLKRLEEEELRAAKGLPKVTDSRSETMGENFKVWGLLGGWESLGLNDFSAGLTQHFFGMKKITLHWDYEITGRLFPNLYTPSPLLKCHQKGSLTVQTLFLYILYTC